MYYLTTTLLLPVYKKQLRGSINISKRDYIQKNVLCVENDKINI